MKILKTIGKYAVVAMAAGFLAVVAAVLYGVISGAVSSEKLDTVGKALKGELVEYKPQETVPQTLADTFDRDALKEAKTAVEALGNQRDLLVVQVNERRGQVAMLEREAADISKRIVGEREDLAKAEKAFGDKRTAWTTALEDEGFKKTVKTLDQMDEASAAQMVYENFTEDEAVRLLRAFKDDKRATLLTEIDRIDRQKVAEGARPKAGMLLKRIWKPDAVAGRTIGPEVN